MTRRKSFARQGDILAIFIDAMNEKTLSVFVDESGNFGYPDRVSRYYVVGLVLHDQGTPIQPAINDLDLTLRDLHLPYHVFHAGPLIRREKGYEFMDWRLRQRIFSAMMAFARKIDFKYFCLTVDKNYVSSREQIFERLEQQLSAFLDRHSDALRQFDVLKVYYDCGQADVTRLLHRTISSHTSGHVVFTQGVEPRRYKMFQLADLICTLRLLELKIENGQPLTESETRFFGGPRDFKRNVLKKMKAKELS